MNMWNDKSILLMITCEHASNRIPDFLKKYFNSSGNINPVVDTHRGYDIGAYSIYQKIVKLMKPDFTHACGFSRLVADVNRSHDSDELFSEYVKNISAAEKRRIMRLYNRYLEPIYEFVDQNVDENEIVHIGIHSFTGIFNDVIRDADIGILFDATRERERYYAEIFRRGIMEYNSDLRIRFNYPYRGDSDGLTTNLRKLYGKNYIGIEIEINQELL